MAKIAGRKNDGAWYRFNVWILKQPSSVQSTFAAALENTETISPAFQAIQSYIDNVGAPSSIFPTSVQAWALELSIGIPRQIWEGVTTYDYYIKGPKGGGFVYTKEMQPTIFKFSVDVRDLAKTIRFSTFELEHLAGLTHPPSASAKAAAETAQETRARVRAALMAYVQINPLPGRRPAKNALTGTGDESISPVLPGGTGQPPSRKAAARA